MATPQAMCISCGYRPKRIEGNRVHDYCSRGCAQRGPNPNVPQTPVAGPSYFPPPTPAPMPWPAQPMNYAAPGICALPGCNRPVFVDHSNKPSLWCGRGHMAQGQAQGIQPSYPAPYPPVPAQPSHFVHSGFHNPPAPAMTAQAKAAAGLCLLSSCMKPVWRDASGTPSQYCSKAHRTQHISGNGVPIPAQSGYQPTPAAAPAAPLKNPCLHCKQREQWQTSPFCGRGCLGKAQSSAPSLIEIPNTHPKFKDVANQFTVKWNTAYAPTPTVRHVYMIMTSAANMKKFENYRDRIEAKNHHKSKGMEPGNQQRRWHGTRRMCKLGDPGNTTLCTNTTCALCNIIRSSFDMKYASQGLFGTGIYTSATPSKSDSYITSTGPLKPILLNKVIVGRGYNLNTMNITLTSPPAGFDSVLGQLANDELIVYNNDAIRPAYLIMYN